MFTDEFNGEPFSRGVPSRHPRLTVASWYGFCNLLLPGLLPQVQQRTGPGSALG